MLWASALALPLLGCGAELRRPQRPSVLVLDIDTLRADHLGCYGSPRATSPRIDRFSAQAHRFEWAFAQAPYTPPSQSSIMTGLYVSHHGVRTRRDRLADGLETMAETFRANGYQTAAFVDGGFLSRGFGFDQGFDAFDDEAGGLARIGPKVSQWLGRDRAQPFFLFVHSYDVHTPYDPPAGYRELFLDGLEPPSPGFEPSSEAMERARVSMWTDDPEPLPPNDLRYAEALYDAEIRFVDDWVGAILDRLAEVGIAGDTIVVLVSDHGEEFGEHGSVLHEKNYATVTRIPLIIRMPEQRSGVTHSSLVQSVDLAPTLFELAGIDPPSRLDGRSLAPLLRGEDGTPAVAFGENPWATPGEFLVDASRHLMYRPGTDRFELFDYRRDPWERRDLSASEPETVMRMARMLRARIASLGESPDADATIDDETERQLRALGYL